MLWLCLAFSRETAARLYARLYIPHRLFNHSKLKGPVGIGRQNKTCCATIAANQKMHPTELLVWSLCSLFDAHLTQIW